MKAVAATFNQEKALVGALSVITNLRMELFEALIIMRLQVGTCTERLLHDHKPLLETVRMQACWLAHYGNMEDVIRWGHVTRDS